MIVFCVEQLRRLPCELRHVPQSRLIEAMLAVAGAQRERSQQMESQLDANRSA